MADRVKVKELRAGAAVKAEHLVEIKDLRTHFPTHDGIVKAVDGVSFEIEAGKTLGIVGESGCGKSITALSIMKLIEKPGRIVSGSIKLDGFDLVKASDDEMRQVRGNEISMIFQEPFFFNDTATTEIYTW
jgi:ABC-type dipeptide/oligopeptide/nickel transport system ATPase component